MVEARRPEIYSIAAHRGFADALVAGLVPRYGDDKFGLARLTLLLPSSRAARTVSEAFVRHAGETGRAGLLLPRMVLVGDLDLDEAMGPLLDSLGAGAAIPPAAHPVRRWLRLATLITQHYAQAPRGSALLRLAFELGRTIDRLLVEEKSYSDLLDPDLIGMSQELAGHWQRSLRNFAKVQASWQAELDQRGEVDAAQRRNHLFHAAAKRLREAPPPHPIVSAGVTSAAPALADLLKTISQLPQGAVILPDFDLTMGESVWDELGSADGQGAATPFGRDDAVTHPQYHLKLLLNRMAIARSEVRPWHRAGLAKGPPERSHAISSLFLPPEASKAWVNLPRNKRQLSGVRLIEAANPEEEAQAIALLVREVLEQPEKRVAVVTPDRGLAARVVQHLRRWNITADDSAGRPLSQTAAGRVLLLLAELAAEKAAPVPLMALLQHPLVQAGDERTAWLTATRKLELELRGPRIAPGLAPIAAKAAKAGVAEWFDRAQAILARVLEGTEERDLAVWLDQLSACGEALCGTGLWAREDGRALSGFIEELRLHARDAAIMLAAGDLPTALREAMDRVAVRPPYGSHPRVAIYGLLEARMTRADLVICAGLNEKVWPPAPASDPLLAPAVLRALGVPGADFRIGLAAHDLAGAMGAPEVVLSRARRDSGGPAIASRFLLRVRALLGSDLVKGYEDPIAVELARAIDPVPVETPHYPRPAPMPSADQRRRKISVTALDRLRSDPYQFYASNILRLKQLDLLDAAPTAAWQGTLAHTIIEQWHGGQGTFAELTEQHLQEMAAHPLQRALWRPRLLKALEWVAWQLAQEPGRVVVAAEADGAFEFNGVTIFGRADRIDRMPDGTLAVVDYKTGGAPSSARVEKGFTLQLGTLGLILGEGGFDAIDGQASMFEYWSLGRNKDSPTGFGYTDTPLKTGRKRSGLTPDEFLPKIADYLHDALDRYILGNAPFTARENPDAPVYDSYDQLMRLGEWLGRESEDT